MRLYADAAAFTAAGYGEAPANIALLLRNASRTIDTLLIGKVYDTDADTGLPTDADVIEAMSDACCAIAAEAAATGVLTAGQTTGYTTVGIGNVSLSGKQLAEGSLVIDGMPVPASALAALATVGYTSVSTVCGGYVRPLDRIEQ